MNQINLESTRSIVPQAGIFTRLLAALRPFGRFFDRYYFLTAIIIAQNSVTRQYRDSFLGVIWTVLQPTVQIIVYSLIFARIMRFPVENYVLYLIGSLLVWQLIAGVLIGSCNSIIMQSETIKRCMVSLTVFPVADVFRALYTYGISFGVMYAYALLFLVQFKATIFLLPLVLIPILIALMALSIALAFASPYIRDIGEVMTVLLNVAFWLTPIIYPLEAMPADVQPLYEYNPFYIMIRPVNMVVHDGVIPDGYAIGMQLLLTFVAVVVSYVIYRICRKNFVYYL
jgi:lipopolysaccharide transport system permease protein